MRTASGACRTGPRRNREDLGHDLLGNTLAAALITGLGYTAKKIRAKVRNRNGNTDRPAP
ncbi:hypothetical protein ACGFYQ_42000 [Streptomyces sp. NPDC048258]|uniref:hypothetical protein n=1 Tax=Streptomyces sp. NPDC048258 TaxID=3365527 RepID=UPI003710320F